MPDQSRYSRKPPPEGDFEPPPKRRRFWWRFLLGSSQVVDVFAEYTSSDIRSTAELLELMKLAAAARSASIDQVHFPAELGPSYVYASERAIRGAVREFLGKTGPHSTASGARQRAKPKNGGKAKPGAERPVTQVAKPGSDGLVPAREIGEEEAKIVARKVGGGFPVFYPVQLPAGAAYVESNPYLHVQDPRVYHLKDGDGDGERHAAYRLVAVFGPEYDPLYVGIQGIRGWKDPPILQHPSETRTIHGREYEIFIDGEHVKLVAWHRGENTYWIANNLQQSLSNEQMLGIARSARVMLPKQGRGASASG